jgi:hypothetical protein
MCKFLTSALFCYDMLGRYGNAMNVKRTVRGYAQTGFAAMMIEDQVTSHHPSPSYLVAARILYKQNRINHTSSTNKHSLVVDAYALAFIMRAQTCWPRVCHGIIVQANE